MPEQRYVGHVGYCDAHGKRLYSDRKKARQQIRAHRHHGGMREYRCDLVAGHWHVGHLPPAVRTGRKTATEVYGGGQ
ncbi:hypothetical protein [Micromonospora sp. HUAS LYJ1]|uniref:hypothetical protein n=1 Tax=Micromonospora sp. HUAS LYJ1 TaxID=3061626 RepID=UPI00267239D8|nr:hypothetical protein [Micromonospora sp. HUAS LYJ1]WKU07983.1 hypothetical protein Q2K16_13620 [Micromonospora sp. HUAS LYJ1]